MNSSAADKFIIQRNKLKQHIEDGISSDVKELDQLEEKIAYIIAEEEKLNSLNSFVMNQVQ